MERWRIKREWLVEINVSDPYHLREGKNKKEGKKRKSHNDVLNSLRVYIYWDTFKNNKKVFSQHSKVERRCVTLFFVFERLSLEQVPLSWSCPVNITRLRCLAWRRAY